MNVILYRKSGGHIFTYRQIYYSKLEVLLKEW